MFAVEFTTKREGKDIKRRLAKTNENNCKKLYF